MAKHLEAKTERTEKGLASADRTLRIPACATKGKTGVGEGSREKLHIDLADTMRVTQTRWRSRRHRKAVGEAAKGCPPVWGEAAAL